MVKIKFQYLLPGQLEVNLPDNININNIDDLKKYLEDILENMSNQDIIDGTKFDFNSFGKDMLDETPRIENIENMDVHKNLYSTPLWEVYQDPEYEHDISPIIKKIDKSQIV